MVSRNERDAAPIVIERIDGQLIALAEIVAADRRSPRAAATLVKALRAQLAALRRAGAADRDRSEAKDEVLRTDLAAARAEVAKLRQRLKDAESKSRDSIRQLNQLRDQMARAGAAERRSRMAVQELHRYVRRLENLLDRRRPVERDAPASPLHPSRWRLGRSRPSGPLGSEIVTVELLEGPRTEIPDGAAPNSREAYAAWNDLAPQPLAPSAGRINYAVATAGLPVVALLMFGMDGERIAALVETVGEEIAIRPAFAPLFVTDCKDFAPFRRDRYAFEYIPADREFERLAGDLDWRAYLARRAVRLRDKWRPRSVVTIGAAPPFPPDLLRVPGPRGPMRPSAPQDPARGIRARLAHPSPG